MTTISDELLVRFINNETSAEETITVLDAMKSNPELMRRYISVKRFDKMMAEEEEPALPMEKLAAKSEDNMCDILCERYILRNRMPVLASTALMSEAKDEQRFLNESQAFNKEAWLKSNEEFFTTPLDKTWLTTNGVALYNVGRIMEGYGLSVTRHFYSSIEALRKMLSRGESLIAIVNEELLRGEPTDDNSPNHAICVTEIGAGVVKAYNPSTGNEEDEYSLADFEKAWATSKNYVVAAGKKGKKVYEPTPINLDEVNLDDDLEDLLEAIAENAHDVWAHERILEGYAYGPVNNSDPEKGSLTNKDLRPYSELPETEKEYDRKLALSTLKLAKRLGFKVTRTNPDEDYSCPDCGKRIGLEMSYCPHCGRELQLEDFIK